MSQFKRVVSICKGRKWWTLREIEDACILKFSEFDTQSAISARLRDHKQLEKLGLKQDRVGPDPKYLPKKLYKYRLIKI